MRHGGDASKARRKEEGELIHDCASTYPLERVGLCESGAEVRNCIFYPSDNFGDQTRLRTTLDYF
jgi:hypothetical protein